MIRRILLTMMTVLPLAVATAAPLTPEEALGRLDTSGGPMRAPSRAGRVELTYTRHTDGGAPAVYVFNQPAESGYMVLSADDSALPLLGYCDNGTFDATQMPPELEWWLDEYARQIEYGSARGTGSDALRLPVQRAGREAIAPMLQTKWDQGAPYYNQCPLVGVTRAYTGCVATAMSQVMNYWQYPEVGRGQISYEAESISKRLTLNFANRKFDWANMCDTYADGQYSDKQADAVAYLMKAAGYSVRMDYGTDSSGALAMYIANALKNFFNYDPNIRYTLRQYYSATEWSDMIYDNLKNVGPLLYGGGSLIGGGHSFVCDGYDGKGYFHFNWGWSGMSDGYFSLDALSPGSLGTGGGGGGGYNFTQDVILGIQPPTGEPVVERPLEITQVGSLAGYIVDDVLHFDLFAEGGAMWVNYNPTSYKCSFGAIFEPQGETAGEPLRIPVSPIKYDISVGYGTDPAHLAPQVDLKEAGLSEGTYKVTMCTFKPENPEGDWLPVHPNYGYYNYIKVTRSGDKYSCDVADVAGLGVLDAEIVGDLVYGCPATFRMTATNTSDIELTRGFAPTFVYDNVMCFLGESVMVTLAPGETREVEWTTDIYAMGGAPSIDADTRVGFTFFDEMTYMGYDQDFYTQVIMRANPGLPYVSCWAGMGPKVTNALMARKEEINGEKQTVYLVLDKSDIRVMGYVGLDEGYFHYPMMAVVCQPDAVNPDYLSLETYNGETMFIENYNQRQRFDTSVNFSQGKPGVLYYLMLGFGYQQQIQRVNGPFGYFRIIDDQSGVEAMEGEGLELTYDPSTGIAKAESPFGIEAFEAYDLTGARIGTPAGDGVLQLVPGQGMAVLRAVDREGNTRTLKTMR